MTTPNRIEKALDLKLFVASMGKVFRVMAICKDANEANAAMERNRDWGLIAEDKESGLCFLAEIYGPKCPSEIIRRLYA